MTTSIGQHNYRPHPAILELGEDFFDEVAPANFPKLTQRFRNQEWAERIGLGHLSDVEWLKHFARFEPLPENLPMPLALRYHGHQFQHYNPDLGDGRGFLYAQLDDPVDHRLLDLGTKGSGQTPWSRRGDGRLTLKGAVREVLATEMLEALGVTTSKTFSVFETGENLERHDEPSPTRAAVLVRLNHSHVRFGTFQRFAFHQEQENVWKLIDYCTKHFYPELTTHARADQPIELLKLVALRAADLCAGWMAAGFVHGVLNTDNMNITGESFDYGPYRFLPHYDPTFTAAYFDREGLYAYGRQPESVLWNLEQLASCFLPLLKDQEAGKAKLLSALHLYAPAFNDALIAKFLERMGLQSAGTTKDDAFFATTLTFLSESEAEFPQFFHDWYGGQLSEERALKSPQTRLYNRKSFDAVLEAFADYQPRPEVAERLKLAVFREPKVCGMLIDEIEWIWDAIAKDDDWSRFENKITAIREMGKAYGRRQI